MVLSARNGMDTTRVGRGITSDGGMQVATAATTVVDAIHAYLLPVSTTPGLCVKSLPPGTRRPNWPYSFDPQLIALFVAVVHTVNSWPHAIVATRVMSGTWIGRRTNPKSVSYSSMPSCPSVF